MPTPVTTTSAGTSEPSASRTPAASMPVTETPQRSSVPCSACSRAQTAASSGPSTGVSGNGKASKTTTSRPSERHVEATSAPMNPAPTIATRTPGTKAARKRERVVDRPQRVGAFEARQRARAAAGGDDDAVRVHRTAVRKEHPAVPRLQGRGPHAEPEVQRQRREVAGVEQFQRSARGRPGEERLGQRRPVVGQVRLFADQHDAAVVTLRAQLLRGADPGERSADDRDALHAASSRATPCT